MTPDSVRQAGIDKWQVIVDLIDMGVEDEHLEDWWHEEGRDTCSFCDHYCGKDRPGCTSCPLYSRTAACNKHWSAMADDDGYAKTMRSHAPLMLQQIKDCQ